MSEYQYVVFRAVEGPVSAKNLSFMRQQSSRAEITPWSFENEYHYGDFHGNAEEMLRRGYDFHLHYANFGTRRLMIRLPGGLPDPKAAEPYFDDEGLFVIKDSRGPGVILCVEPAHEPGDLDDLWDIDELVARLLPLRAEILDGDLRPLYLAHLACALDMDHDPEETRDAPVPAGLHKLTDAQEALAELYGLDEALIKAAAQESPKLTSRGDIQGQYLAWLGRQPERTKAQWLAAWMADADSGARREVLAAFQREQTGSAWPTVRGERTIADLQAAAEAVHQKLTRTRAEQAGRKRAKKLAGMAADPPATLRKTEDLAQSRSTAAYEEAADLLADLREALAGTDQADLPAQQARKLKDQNPTRHMLASALRKKGLLKK